MSINSPKPATDQPTSDSTSVKSIAIIYHSAFGHTAKVARAIQLGVSSQVEAHLIKVADLKADAPDAERLWAQIDTADALMFGSPTYMGSVSAEFKTFMDSSSSRWMQRSWVGKWAAGFTVSGGLSGDKLQVLQQLCLFSMQHGMNWASLPLMSTGSAITDLNRLGSHMGLMAQADDAHPDETPPLGDIKTAEWFGTHLATLI